MLQIQGLAVNYANIIPESSGNSWLKVERTEVRTQRYIILLFLGLAVALSRSGVSQTAEDLAALYRDNRILELEALRKSGSIAGEDWKMFTDALFEPDAEVAASKMIEAYSLSSNRPLKTIIRERLSQYYAARGYYETAKRILNDEEFFQGVLALKASRRAEGKTAGSASQPPKGSESGQTFGVQVGAYSSFDNAERASQKYRQNYSNVRVLEKEKPGSSLYVVVIGAYPSREEAAVVMERIQKEFKVKGYIIQY